MRDLDRWKDKVELSLDGRQIFFLFFGSAVAACLIFVVGVLIGKRLEARALALQPPAVEDPLAALDQLGDADEAAEGLTYHKALTHGDKPKLEAHAAPKPAPAPAPAPAPLASEGANASENASAIANANANASSNANANANAGANANANANPIANANAVHPKPLPPARPQVVAQQPKKPDPKAPAAAHYTLQLSAFPERADAEEFMRKIQSAGYKPFLVASEIPGKGVFYRVRVGDFATKQAATDAKGEFERKQRMIAYVARL